MGYRVVMACPDRHTVYDGLTPDEVGVGGGVTARVRMARALARAGHDVAQIVNCPRQEVIDGVAYLPLDAELPSEADVLIVNTSGGDLDLRPALELPIEARLRIVWLHGTMMPEGLEDAAFDVAYAVSNFVAQTAIREWGLAPARLFVCYNGYEEAHFAEVERGGPPRDPFRLVYFSHPSKGLEAARAVLRRLRAIDPRFELHVCGGEGLWAQAETEVLADAGEHFHGLIGQRALAEELLRAGFSLQMQTRPEPGALAIADAQRAGCVIVGSPVGCYPEMVGEGQGGFLIPGNPHSDRVRDLAASQIRSLAASPDELESVGCAARRMAWDTDTLAAAWAGDWDRRLEPTVPVVESTCAACGGQAVVLPDGAHCTLCSHYARAPVASQEELNRVPGGMANR